MKHLTCITICILLLFTSCVDDWESPYEDIKYEMNLNVVALADSLIYGEVYRVLNSLNPDRFSSDPTVSLSHAVNAHFTVNDSNPIYFDNHHQTSYFSKNYPFKPGDTVMLHLSQYYYNTVEAVAIIPDKPDMEIEYIETKSIDSDTLMVFRIKIKDNPQKNNFYMLNATSYSDVLIKTDYDNSMNNFPNDTTYWIKESDPVFYSDSPIFIDNKVINHTLSDNRKFQDNFSYVFSDVLFNGQEYECIIECPKISHKEYTEQTYYYKRYAVDYKYYISITLSELSKDYFNYQKMWEYANLEEPSTFCFSAVEGGMGVLGAVNRTKPVRFDFKK